MSYRTYFAILISCFLAGCGTTGPDNTARVDTPQMMIKKPILIAQDGSGFVVLTGPAPDGGYARIIVPSGKGFAAATLKEVDADEPLKISVNKWLNKLCNTNDIAYVDLGLHVTPVLRDEGQFDMVQADVTMVNEALKARGFNLKVFSSEEGLNCTE